MTALDRLTLAFMQIPMTEEGRTELHKLVKEAEEEQAELVAALRDAIEFIDFEQNEGELFRMSDDRREKIDAVLARFPLDSTQK